MLASKLSRLSLAIDPEHYPTPQHLRCHFHSPPPVSSPIPMRKSVLTLFSFITLTALSGCGDPPPTSMTDGVPLSDIEAYEQEVLNMESESAGEMEIDEREPEKPAE